MIIRRTTSAVKLIQPQAPGVAMCAALVKRGWNIMWKKISFQN